MSVSSYAFKETERAILADVCGNELSWIPKSVCNQNGDIKT